MTEKTDRISRRLLRYIDILMLKNPERTVLGVLLGVVVSFLFKLFEPYLSKIDILNLAKLQLWEFISFGVIIVHIPYLLWSIIRKPLINDEVDDVIRLIESGNFSEKEKRQMYRNLVNKCVNSLSLGKKRQLKHDAGIEAPVEE